MTSPVDNTDPNPGPSASPETQPMSTLQFQTAHAQRQVPLLLLHSPVIVGVCVGIDYVTEGDVLWALWGSLWVIGIVVGSWIWARQRRLGLFISPRAVTVSAAFGGQQHAVMTREYPPTLSVASTNRMQRFVVMDAFGQGAPVAWLVRMTRRDPVRTLGFGIPNDVLVREPESQDPEARRWRKAGIVWTEHNSDEVINFLTQAIQQRLGLEQEARLS
jgi:hypothetical protein